MTFQNRLRQHRVIVYRLKRLFGMTVTFTRRTASDVYNLETGALSRTTEDIIVRRVIVLTDRQVRRFHYDLSYIAANKNFTYGGYFDLSTRIMIVDAHDLPSGWEFDHDMWATFEGRRYQIKEVHEAENYKGYLLVTEHETSQVT